MIYLLGIAWSVILVVCCPLRMLAQVQTQFTKPPEVEHRYVIEQRVEEVLLYCTVIDRKGHPFMNLSRANFSVFEDGKRVPVTHFAKEDLPVSLSLVLDDSTSMKEKRTVVKSAALELVKASYPEDETSITNFADKAYVDQKLTGDISKLQSALAKDKTISGGTALFDTLIAAADRLSSNANRKKQVIVVITDGKDNASEADLADAIRRVQRADGPVIYAIGLLYDLPGSDERRSRKELSSLADETGGISFFPSSAAEADRVADEVAQDVHHQYTISFHPVKGAAAGSYHSIAVRASARGAGRLTVRTRKGYFRRANSESPER